MKTKTKTWPVPSGWLLMIWLLTGKSTTPKGKAVRAIARNLGKRVINVRLKPVQVRKLKGVPTP